MDYKKLGLKIKDERIKAKLTQQSLAEAVDLSPVFIGQIERGERKLSLESLIKIANVLNCSIDSLVKDSMPSNISARKNELLHLLEGHSDKEILLIVNTAKTILTDLKNNS